MAHLSRTLEACGHDTFLPQRDGLEGLALRLAALPGARSGAFGVPDRLLRRAIFAVDVYQLVERCDAVVWNLNGRVPDEGAVVEASLAFAVGKPLVAYKDDARSVFEGHDNPMLTGLVHEGAVARTISEVPAALARALSVGARDAAASTGARPAALRDTLRFGGGVWRLLEAAPSLRMEKSFPRELRDELERLDGTDASRP